MVEPKQYGLFVHSDASYADTLARVKDALRQEGFGVLTEIDVAATMKERLGTDFRHYDIIGACNPPLAHRALTAEIDIGLLLPCNVIVYEDDTDAGCVVAALDPAVMTEMTDNETLRPIADEARDRLLRALDAVASG